VRPALSNVADTGCSGRTAAGQYVARGTVVQAADAVCLAQEVTLAVGEQDSVFGNNAVIVVHEPVLCAKPTATHMALHFVLSPVTPCF